MKSPRYLRSNGEYLCEATTQHESEQAVLEFTEIVIFRIVDYNYSNDRGPPQFALVSLTLAGNTLGVMHSNWSARYAVY